MSFDAEHDQELSLASTASTCSEWSVSRGSVRDLHGFNQFWTHFFLQGGSLRINEQAANFFDQNCQMFIFLFYALVGISSYSDSWMTLRLELSDKMNTFIFFWRRKPFSGDSSHSLTSRPSTVSKQKKMRF